MIINAVIDRTMLHSPDMRGAVAIMFLLAIG
jgi:hypothetical protein